MKICYQLATEDVKTSWSVTSYQGDTQKGFEKLHELGYDGVELMMRDPNCVNKEKIVSLAQKYHLEIPMICTGEVYGQDGMALSHEKEEIRIAALERIKAFMDFASQIGAGVNIGRFRGQYYQHVAKELTEKWAFDAFKRIAEYAQKKKVVIALEPVNILQSNFIQTTQDGMKVVDSIGNDYFKIMLDIFHMHMMDKDLLSSIEESSGYVSYVHYSDSNRLSPGSCKLDFVKITEALRKTGYDGYIGVEVFQLPNQDVVMQKSIEYLKSIIHLPQQGMEVTNHDT